MYLYSKEDYFLLRKPRGVASTFGDEKSVLDCFDIPWDLQSLYKNPADTEILSTYVDISTYTQEDDLDVFQKNQVESFSRKQEYGLLNRLDTPTGGFLYFAKTPKAFAQYKADQKQGRIEKTYIAFVEGNPCYKDEKKAIDIYFPIMHLASNPEKMIVVRWFHDENKWRGKRHKGKTSVQLIQYFEKEQKSLVKVTIHKWIRHQIRVHLASIWAPILGDNLYNNKAKVSNLQLRSVGFTMV